MKEKKVEHTGKKIPSLSLPKITLRPQKSHRWALTLLFTGIVVLIILATILVVTTITFILIKTGVINSQEEAFSDGTLIVMLVASACLIVGIGATFLISRIPLKPVNRLINALNRLASGDFKARIYFGKPFNSHPTVKELTDSFNTMAAELERTEVLRSDFINNFSHEFKAPIASIAGFAKLLKRGNLTEEQREEYLDIIEEESLRLSNMATNVLNLNKVESQTILTDVSCFNLSEQIRTCVLLLNGKMEKKNIDLTLDFDEITVTANEELLKQVWINLLDNAIKFTPEEGLVCVTIRTGMSDGRRVVEISNTGPEIPPESREKIFQKFYQGDTSHSSQGNGIGLAIVRRVVELHCGQVSVDCKDGVTTFTVVLPHRQPL